MKIQIINNSLSDHNEAIEDIDETFINSKTIDDRLNEGEKIINKKYNKFADIKCGLNTKINNFIKAKNNLNENNKQKIDNNKKITDKSIEEKDIFSKKQPRGIEIKNVLLLNSNSIKVEEENLEGDKSKLSKIYWYNR